MVNEFVSTNFDILVWAFQYYTLRHDKLLVTFGDSSKKMRVLIPVPLGGVSVRYLQTANERIAFRVVLLASDFSDER
jgi:hypothetical protein